MTLYSGLKNDHYITILTYFDNPIFWGYFDVFWGYNHYGRLVVPLISGTAPPSCDHLRRLQCKLFDFPWAIHWHSGPRNGLYIFLGVFINGGTPKSWVSICFNSNFWPNFGWFGVPGYLYSLASPISCRSRRVKDQRGGFPVSWVLEERVEGGGKFNLWFFLFQASTLETQVWPDPYPKCGTPRFQEKLPMPSPCETESKGPHQIWGAGMFKTAKFLKERLRKGFSNDR